MILDNNNFKMIIGKNVPETDAPSASAEEDKQELLYRICSSIRDGGFDPVSQLVGFIISDDPTHISNYNNARTLINRIDRDELLSCMVAQYLCYLNNKYDKNDEI